MRKLVSIQQIKDIQPIPEADFIEKVNILGWWVVVKKGEFKIGDLCIYHEIDSLLPIKPEYEFLLKGSHPKKSIYNGKEIEGIHLRTVRLRGQISQGLCLPVSDCYRHLAIDSDLTDLLGVVKYEKPIPVCLWSEVKGNFPDFIPKTDEERIQNIYESLILTNLSSFDITEKLDGSSCTMYKYNNEFGVCSRRMDLKKSDKNTFWNIAGKYSLKEKLPNGFAIQGECIGEGIQDNHLRLKGQDIYIFYVFDIANQKYLSLKDERNFVKELGLKSVPWVSMIMDIKRFPLNNLIELANGKSSISHSRLREGLVFRNNDKRKFSFKIISNEYLLKWGL